MRAFASPANDPQRSVDDGPALVGEILSVVRDRCGVDLGGYRPETTRRRIRNRMISAQVASPSEYLALLEADPREAALLLDRLTIKVSRFFRNAAAVASVQVALAARAAAAGGRRLSAWSAGCARGEEPYTLAILLAEIGEPAGGPPQVLGTDLDPGALSDAARACYGEEALAEVAPEIVARHFEPPTPARPAYRVSAATRARVALRRHDLVGDGDAPGRRRFDLVACRNVLIYLTRPLRLRAERLLRSSVAPGGLLWLGEAEWPSPEIAAQLEVVDGKGRLFRVPEERS